MVYTQNTKSEITYWVKINQIDFQNYHKVGNDRGKYWSKTVTIFFQRISLLWSTFMPEKVNEIEFANKKRKSAKRFLDLKTRVQLQDDLNA